MPRVGSAQAVSQPRPYVLCIISYAGCDCTSQNYVDIRLEEEFMRIEQVGPDIQIKIQTGSRVMSAGVYYLIRHSDTLRVVTAGQMTRRSQSRLYETHDGLVGVLFMNTMGRWEKDQTFPPEYRFLGKFDHLDDALREREVLRAVEQVHQS